MTVRGVAMLALAFLGSAADARADEPACPSAELAYVVHPAVSLSPPAGADVATRESRLGACLFGTGEESGHLALGMDYAYTRHEYDGVRGRDRDLHRLQFPLAFGHEADGWRIDGVIAPGVATSSNVFKDLTDRGTGEDFLLTTRIEARVPRSRGSAWILGVGHDRSFGESRTYPVAGLARRAGDRLALRLAWPDPALVFALSDRQSLRIGLRPAGQRWHVVSDEIGGRFDYRLEAWRIQATWSVRVASGVALDVGLGREFRREHGFTDDTGVRFDATAGDGPVFGIGLRLGGLRPHGVAPTTRFSPSTNGVGAATLAP